MKKYMVQRSQKSRGSSGGGFGGPDAYIAVVTVPDGVPFDPQRTPLQHARLEAKGIRVEYAGEYYSQHTSPRSRMYAEALAAARELLREEEGNATT